jgi:hypothetical protein
MKKVQLFFGLMLSSALIFSSCKKDEMEDETPNNPQMMTSTYTYEFNNGQVIPSAAYSGSHHDNLMASMMIEEISATQTKITVTLMNTVGGAEYMVHAHDAADPGTTPNGTPYNESPNGDVFLQHIHGNGGDAFASQTINMSFSQVINDYEGFFVVHDPLQPISTTDIATYLVVGTFARMQASTEYARQEFNYHFNTGQVAPQFAYDGMHPINLMGKLTLQELGNGGTRVSVALMNSVNGQMYMVHAHDAADPATTPNGTPYDETPNGDVCSVMVSGNGGTAMANQLSALSVEGLTSMYEGFFVVHDPMQPISTTDPTTYVILGLFAR